MYRFEDQAVKARIWLVSWIGCGLVLSLVALSTAWPIADLLSGHHSPADWLDRAIRYYRMLSSQPQRVLQAYVTWWRNGMAQDGHPPLLILFAGLPLAAAVMEGLRWNPYDWEHSSHGNARPATIQDLKRWARKRVVPYFFWLEMRRAQNLLDSGGIILGSFKPGLFARPVLIRSRDTLSCLVLAAPGSGKTAGIAIPTILDDGNANSSMFIYDIKGELYEKTAGYRSMQGPVFRFEPKGRTGARYNPLSHTKSLPGGLRYIALIQELDSRLSELYTLPGVSPDEVGLLARVNLLRLLREDGNWRDTLRENPACLGTVIDETTARHALCGGSAKAAGKANDRMPIAELAVEAQVIGGEIENYLMRIAASCRPDNPNAGGNKYFDDTARELLFGWMGFTVFRAFRLGLEPNFARLIDWWGEAARRGAEEIAQKGQDAGEGGPNQAALDLWIKECEVYGYPERYRQVLVSQRANAEKTLANVVSTADTSINIFKLATIRDRTSTSDFAIEDMRGMTGKDGKSYPITLYIVVSLEDLKSMAPILMMLTESIQSRLISQPAHIAANSRPVMSILDEVFQIPKMDILLQGPAVGRSQKVTNLLIGQSNGQIDQTYGAGGRATLYDTTEWKVIFPLTSKQTAEEFSGMIGQRTVRNTSFGRRGFDIASIFEKGGGGSNINTSQAGQPLFTASDLMSTEDGGKLESNEQIVVVRGRANRPLICKTPYYFQNKVYDRRARLVAPKDAKGFCGKLAALQPEEIRIAPIGISGVSSHVC